MMTLIECLLNEYAISIVQLLCNLQYIILMVLCIWVIECMYIEHLCRSTVIDSSVCMDNCHVCSVCSTINTHVLLITLPRLTEHKLVQHKQK